MSTQKLSYADVLKNQSGFLNRGMQPTPLIPKATRVRLSVEEKSKIRAIIHEKPGALSEYDVAQPIKSEAGEIVKAEMVG